MKTIVIKGMMCAGCVNRVTKALNAIDGVSASVELASGTAALELSKPVSDDALKNAVEDLGFEVAAIK